MRLLLFGLIAGLILSAMRAPRGLDFAQLPAVGAGTAMLFRAGALLAVVLFLDPARAAFRRRGASAVPLLFAAALGYGLHGLFLASRWQPASRAGFALLLVVGTLCLYLAAGKRRPLDEEPERVGRLERLGLAVAGAGVAIGLENVARHLRLFQVGLAEGDTVVGLVLLAGLLVGALAFGRSLARGERGRVFAAAALAAGTASTLAGLHLLGLLGPDPLYRLLHRFGSDFTQMGTARVTGVLAARSLVLPAFLIGIALEGARHPRRLGSVVAGAAAGLLILPGLVRTLERPLAFEELREHPWAWKLAFLATGTASVGALLALVGGGRAPGRAWLGVPLVVLALAAPFFVRPRVWIFSTWHRAVIQPELTIQTPEGLLSVESDRAAPPTLHLDRQRLTPTVEEQGVDALRLELAWSLLPREKREARDARVLFVGQLTGPRVNVLRGLGLAELDRTAAWHRHFEAVEAILLEGTDSPPGAALAPAQAMRKLKDGAYDLVVVAPVHGPYLYPRAALIRTWGTAPMPAVAGLEAPEGTLAVAWIDASAPVSHLRLPTGVLLALDDMNYLSLGLPFGAEDLPGGGARPHLLPTGKPKARPSGLEVLTTHPYPFRIERHQHLLLERLAAAADGTPFADLARGLEIHFGAQKHSSPWESLAERIEIEEEELRALSRAAKALELDPLLRSIWEGLAWILSEKRMPDLVLSYVEELAELHAPWPALERAVARAFQEFDMPEDVVRMLERIVASTPHDIGLRKEIAEWSTRAGDLDGAERHVREALSIQRGRTDLERQLGAILMRKGDPKGREMIERILRENPEDEEALELLSEGPAPVREAPR